jgi:hypothetical protein
MVPFYHEPILAALPDSHALASRESLGWASFRLKILWAKAGMKANPSANSTHPV